MDAGFAANEADQSEWTRQRQVPGRAPKGEAGYFNLGNILCKSTIVELHGAILFGCFPLGGKGFLPLLPGRIWVTTLKEGHFYYHVQRLNVESWHPTLFQPQPYLAARQIVQCAGLDANASIGPLWL
jgi:hypothetical protein